MVELDYSFTTGKPIDEAWGGDSRPRAACSVRGGRSVLERTGPDEVRAEIKVKMGAMSATFTGTVAVVEQDFGEHRAVMQVKSREAGGQGHANADVTFALSDGGGRSTLRPRSQARRRRWARAVVSVLDAGSRTSPGSLRTSEPASRTMRRGTGRRGAARWRNPRCRRTPIGPCSAATARTTTSASSAGTCSRAAMDPEYMGRRVRIKCGRCTGQHRRGGAG